MIICQSLKEIPSLPGPIGLSIGTFDGVHLGHQALFQLLRQKVSSKGSVAALTFTQHPSQFFNLETAIRDGKVMQGFDSESLPTGDTHSQMVKGSPVGSDSGSKSCVNLPSPIAVSRFNGHAPTPLLCTLEHKLHLLEALGVNLVILIEFSAAFAQQPFDQFLTEIKQHLPFSFLALGQDACFGKDRQGKPESVKALAPQLHFEVDYLDKMLWDHQPISSGRIRNALQQGKLAEVTDLLGRPYSILAPLTATSDSLIMDTTDLCLPPDGTYPIRVGALQGEAIVSNETGTIRLHFPTDPQLPAGSQVEVVF